ncbi:bile acid:sodium symporter family protein [Neptuniibacter halophilus]|uniref:bile acid:sodium symporter family protein n=1 Tax=Neptuniibacter halophilus TaxID=651666 RepID=UPI002573FE8F|nr:bile acid:sodium symporter family protein [Neptuniibacter halophilus]
MGSGAVTQWVLPLALFTIMLGVGMTLKLSEFRLLLRQPGVVMAALLVQLLLLPCLGFAVVNLLQLPAALAVGIMILTFAPGGASSNMITLLARGDTALSVCLTALSGLITPFTMPLLTGMALAYWMGQEAALDFPVAEAMLKLFLIALLPALLGTLINARWPGFCRKAERPVKVLSCLFLLLVVIGIVRANWDQLPDFISVLGPAVLLLVTLAMSAGYLLARKMRLSSAQAVTLAVEVGIQNAATALLVTGGILHNAEMSASALIYGLLMNLPAFMLIASRNLPQKQRLPGGA